MARPPQPARSAWTREAAVLGAAVCLLGGACSAGEGSKPATERTCTEAQAIVFDPYLGTSLGSKKIALTFDDGPASMTAELSTYLKSEGIPAAFFVNGKHLATYPVLPKLVADGHLIGNHTQDHVNLNDIKLFPYTPAGHAGVVAQLAEADLLIAPFVPPKHLLFRAPFGAFDFRGSTVVAGSAMNKYVGHIHWDIGGKRTATTAADWACWQQAPQLTTKACGDLYLAEIASVGRGIVLMHDADYGNSNNHSYTTGLGNTVDMVKYFVPILKAAGYTFVRVDTVPDIALALDPPPAKDAGADAAPDGSAILPASASPADGARPAADPCAPAQQSLGSDHAH